MSTDNLFFYTTYGPVSTKLKSTFQEIVRRRKAIDELKSQSAARTFEIATINDNQDRIRKNMGALDKASALFKRYVSELDVQETRIETLRQEAVRLQHEVTAAQNALRAFTDKLTE